MLFYLQLLMAGAVALGVGLWSADYAIERGLGLEATKRGSWVSWTRAGTANIDPYTEAVFSHSGELPLAGESVIVFSAFTDDKGGVLRTGCTYRVLGKAPPAQFWTLTVYTAANGMPVQNVANRSGYSSTEAVFRPDGSFEAVLSPTPQPGNWIPVPQGDATDELRVFMRFYDTPVSFGRDIGTAAMPRISREQCE